MTSAVIPGRSPRGGSSRSALTGKALPLPARVPTSETTAATPSERASGSSMDGKATRTESPWSIRVISVSGIWTSTRSPLSSLSSSKAVWPLATFMAGSMLRTEIEPGKGARSTERRRSRRARFRRAWAASNWLSRESRVARAWSSSWSETAPCSATSW